VRLNSVIGITNFSGEFAAAVSRVEECRILASSTLKKKATSYSETYQITLLYIAKIQTYMCISSTCSALT
jgi:hypothetical protein